MAKILTLLSRAGIVKGAPGPGGGYSLTCDPATLTLYDVAVIFGRLDAEIMCPLGPGWCGTGPHCPLHHDLAAMKASNEDFLRRHHFGEFCGMPATGPGTA